ncbi:MAG: ClbS/DfsB family four-helix bundle protein [Thermomicrobiales bacterium]
MTEQAIAPESKTELLDRMRSGREEWDALLDQVPDAAREEPVLAGGQSVKDLIAHVAAYENWTAAQIRAANERRVPTDMELYGVEDLPPDPEGWDLDRQNAAIHARYKDKDLAEVVDFAERAFADLTAAVEGVRAEDFARPDAQSWTSGAPLLKIVPGQCYAHYQQHVDELRSLAGRDVV